MSEPEYALMHLTKHADGSVTVDRFPETLLFVDGLVHDFGAPEPNAVIRIDGDRLYLTPANGRATYVRVADPTLHQGMSRWDRLYANLDKAE